MLGLKDLRSYLIILAKPLKTDGHCIPERSDGYNRAKWPYTIKKKRPLARVAAGFINR
jgi:hypothetical protein